MSNKYKYKRILIPDLWEKEFFNAKRFFDSKGNIDTRSKHKDRWRKEFVAMLRKLETTVVENHKKGLYEDVVEDSEL